MIIMLMVRGIINLILIMFVIQYCLLEKEGQANRYRARIFPDTASIEVQIKTYMHTVVSIVECCLD
jgi:hypothetical protein